jgi:hypothetical protein
MKNFVKKSDSDLKEKIAVAQKAVQTVNKEAERNGEEEKVFVRSIYTTLSQHQPVMIKVPSENAPYLKIVPGNSIFSVANEKVSALRPVEVPRHYRHGDFVERREDGSLRPTAIRHFYISKNSLGKTIPAIVEIKKKYDVVTGEETIMVDIFEFKIEKNLEVKNILRLGAPTTGAPGEILIPGQKDRCIKIEEARPVFITC